MRKIIHVDMDAFYAAIEQRDDPALRGRPLAVGSLSQRGVVLTASYEARRFGVRSAMPTFRARQLCPDLLFTPPRFEAYRAASRAIRAVFQRHTELIEPLALDEAYLDVTEPKGGPAPAVEIARAIKAEIREATGLTASAGVSYNKFLAKIASDLKKPDGLAVIRPEQARAFIATLPIERFHGVGPVTARRLKALGIMTGAELQSRSEPELVQVLGRSGRHFFAIAQGRDDRSVVPDRPRRSLSVETTYTLDLAGAAEVGQALAPLSAELASRLSRNAYCGRTLTLKLRYADFTLRTRRLTRGAIFTEAADILETGLQLLERESLAGPVRLLGLGVSSEVEGEDGRQLSFF